MKNEKLENYIKVYKKLNTFEYIYDRKLQESLYQYFGYVFFLFKKLNEIDDELLKTFVAHTIIIYIGSIIEAVIFYYVSEKLTDEKSKRKYLNIEEFKKVQDLKKCENLFICELIKKEISLNDSINFYGLINGLKDKKIISKDLIEKIDYIRKSRNLIHINVFKEDETELILELEKLFSYMENILDYIEIELLK